MGTSEKADPTWAKLADLDEVQRSEQMDHRYAELAVLTEEQRCSRLTAMAHAEYTLPDDKMHPFHLSRLRSWLAMDPDALQRIAASYDSVMDQMPGDLAMRRVGVAQTLAKSFSLAEQDQMRAILPRVFGDRGTATSGWAPSSSGFRTRPVAKKPWWAFWTKR